MAAETRNGRRPVVICYVVHWITDITLAAGGGSGEITQSVFGGQSSHKPALVNQQLCSQPGKSDVGLTGLFWTLGKYASLRARHETPSVNLWYARRRCAHSSTRYTTRHTVSSSSCRHHKESLPFFSELSTQCCRSLRYRCPSDRIRV